MVAVLAGLAKVSFRRLLKGRARPSWTLIQEAIIEALRTHGRLLQTMPPRQARALSDRLQVTGAQTKGTDISVVTLGPCSARTFRPKSGAHPRTKVLYFHGGGYVMGSSDSYRAHLAALSQATGCEVVAPDYRLAPEAPFPAAWEDAVGCLQSALRVHDGAWVVAGDSAGAALALAAAQQVCLTGGPQPAGLLLLSPWVDLSARGGSIEAHAGVDWADGRYLHNYAAQYLHATDPRDPRASPLWAPMQGLPPLLVFVGGAELLRDQVRALVDQAKTAGVQVRVHEDEDMVHGYWMMGPAFAAAEVHQTAAAWIQGLPAK